MTATYPTMLPPPSMRLKTPGVLVWTIRLLSPHPPRSARTSVSWETLMSHLSWAGGGPLLRRRPVLLLSDKTLTGRSAFDDSCDRSQSPVSRDVSAAESRPLPGLRHVLVKGPAAVEGRAPVVAVGRKQTG